MVNPFMDEHLRCRKCVWLDLHLSTYALIFLVMSGNT